MRNRPFAGGFVVVLGICATLVTEAARANVPERIETYGDSLTAGFLSNTNVATPPPLGGPNGISAIITDLANYLLTGDKQKVEKHHHPELAWPQLLAARLAGGGGAVPVVNNYAVSGAKVSDLMTQLGRAGGPLTPTIAVFFIGHNDFADDPPVADTMSTYFTARYRQALRRWDASHTNATAFVLPIGDIPRVFQALRGVVWHRSQNGRSYTCEDSWERFFPYSPSHARRLKDGTLETFLGPRLRAVNTALSRVVDEMNRESTRNRFRFAASVLTRPFESRYFAIDCYHLSQEGQAEVARDVADYLASAE